MMERLLRELFEDYDGDLEWDDEDDYTHGPADFNTDKYEYPTGVFIEPTHY